MAQQIQELINKIRSEGIDVAQEKGREIEAQAHKKAQQIIAEAQGKANKMVADAQEEIKKRETASRMALNQVCRDMLLKLRKEINHLLNAIIQQHVSHALTAENLAQIIETAVKNFLHAKSGEHNIQVKFSSADAEKLKHGFLARLQKELKEPIQFQSAESIHKGFTISFDGGKSSFDFSDESLAEYLGSYLNEEVARILKESVK